MRLAEPATTLTDYVLGFETLFFAALLLRTCIAEGHISVGLWAAGFVATGIAAITGGTFHGFPGLDSSVRSGLWKCTVVAVGVTSLCLFSSATIAAFRGMTRQILLALCIAEFLIYAVWMAGHTEFKYAIYNYAPAMIGILLIQLYELRGSSAAASWIVAGLVVSFAAVGIQQSGIKIHKNLNYNDLYHIIQMGAMFLLYRGGVLLRDK